MREKDYYNCLYFSGEKDGRTKARTRANGNVQRSWMQKEETSIPTAYLEIIQLTPVIDPKYYRDVATIDIPNLFIQTPIDR